MSDLQQTITKLQGMPQAIRQELKNQAKANPSSPILPASLVLENVERLVSLLPCLSVAEAGAMLAPTAARARIPQQQLVAKLVPFLDERYSDLAGQLWEVDLICGAFGSGVIDRAMRDLNRVRRSRGAQELLLLDSLLAIHQNEMLQAQREGREAPSAEKVDEVVLSQYPAALDAFLERAGATEELLVVGSFTLSDLAYFREIKAYLRQTQAELADPFRGDSLRYYRTAMALFEKARVQRMGPITAAKAWEIKRQRAKQPHVLYAPLDGRGAPRWGGIFPNVRVSDTAYVSKPTGEATGTTTRVLTLHGDRLLEQRRVQLLGKYGLTPGPQAQAAMALELEGERQKLLTTDAPEGERPTWRWNATASDLGFEVEEVMVERDSPDYGLSAWEAIPIQQALEQMAEFHRSRGSDAAPPVI